jgi:hypothetical protein
MTTIGECENNGPLAGAFAAAAQNDHTMRLRSLSAVNINIMNL